MNRIFSTIQLLFLIITLLLPAGQVARAESEAELERWALKSPKARLPKYVDFLNNRLEEVYQHELSKMTPKNQELLRASQAAWKAYLDADLNAERGDESLHGGSGEYMRLAQRRIWQTKLRIYQLETPFIRGWPNPPYKDKVEININGSDKKISE